MMIFLCLSLMVIAVLSADCGTDGEKPGTPQLIITVANIDNAATNNFVYGNILSGKNAKKATWIGWHRLWDSNCDNFERGDTNVFDDFSHVTDEWHVIALHICGTDGIIIDKIRYWNGHSMSELDYFCTNVVGADGYPQCFNGLTEITDKGSCFDTAPQQSMYNGFWIDGDGDCQTVTIKTDFKSTTGQHVGTSYIKSSPGKPDCGVNNNNMHDLEYQLFGDADGEWGVTDVLYENITYYNIISIIIAVLCTSILLYAYFKRKYDQKQEYKPLL